MRNSLTTPLALRRTGSTPNANASARSKPGAFTLIEVLVALAVLVLMLSIILVPINMGLNVFHIGKARSEVQQANQLVLNQLAAELKGAVFVFPNEAMPGITNKTPYSSVLTVAEPPYYDATATPPRVSNTARLDFLLPAVAANGSILTPPQPNNYLVTYYARRLNPDLTKPYDVFTNPVVLWRAQYPYRNDDGTASTVANLNSSRYGDWSNPSNNWLKQTDGEPNLESQSNYATLTAAASHTQITPRDMALVVDPAKASLADTDPNKSFQPDSSFICDDANGDGKIDRVTMSLLLQKYDSLGAADDKSQQIRSTQSVALPNIK